ncbi:histidine triad nucleotide-binding protein [Crassaminicella thermophila]|uniref:Histidine triad nucleotide-binding protein n=1 Tax=Crassaminicella thermophila TaxID=2599308 RepID=A0A5C0SCV4_CRATE|nr:histidine triad nucleotide-binding protein [Crassaminicella thermophila]QEK12365.1 histidine triad nucleotide-binding protein [Crassaminicella thermophila]
MADCIFCKIVSKEIPSKVVYEDDDIMAFHDIEPQAPTHVIVIPKKHIQSIDHIYEEHKELLGHILLSIKNIAKELGLEDGYRVVNNCGELGGQTVNHIHFHLLGGRQLQWPPG